MSLFSFLMTRKLIVYISTFVLLIIGVVSGLNLQREAYPRVEFGVVTISTLYTGASAEEVERLVTTPLEDAIN